MAKMYLVLDDVVAALRNGKKVTADREDSFVIPGRVSDTGKRRQVKVDLSPEGEQLLAKAIEKKDEALANFEARKQAALKKVKADFLKEEKRIWQELNKIANHVNPPAPKKKKEEKAKDDTEKEQEQKEPIATEATQEPSAPNPPAPSVEAQGAENSQPAPPKPLGLGGLGGGLGIPRPGFATPNHPQQ